MTDYATVVPASLAQDPYNAPAAAEWLSEPVRAGPRSAVLKGLQRPWHVISRGAGRLSLRGGPIKSRRRTLDVFEGPIAITGARISHCGIERLCRVGGAWQRVNAAIRRALEDVTLHQLAGLDSNGLRVADLASEIRVNT